ncbi:MAG: hypothetical protein R3E83_15660 [Burkholderiaceae bacterium]
MIMIPAGSLDVDPGTLPEARIFQGLTRLEQCHDDTTPEFDEYAADPGAPQRAWPPPMLELKGPRKGPAAGRLVAPDGQCVAIMGDRIGQSLLLRAVADLAIRTMAMSCWTPHGQQGHGGHRMAAYRLANPGRPGWWAMSDLLRGDSPAA